MKAISAQAFVLFALIALTVPASVYAQERRDKPVCPRVKECLPMAKAGNMRAQTDLAYIYHFPGRIPTNKRKAVYWYSKAAKQGDLSSMNNLGTLLMHNEFDGISNQKDKALKWWQKAAKRGYAKAQANLSGVYRGDLTFEKDQHKAFKWALKAAKRGMPKLQRDVAIMYQDGYGVSRNMENSARWFRKAAKQGVVEAQATLGTLYGTGKGVPKNYIKAYAWLDIAAQQDLKAAQSKLTKLKPFLSERETSVAQKLSNKYHDNFVQPYQ